MAAPVSDQATHHVLGAAVVRDPDLADARRDVVRHFWPTALVGELLRHDRDPRLDVEVKAEEQRRLRVVRHRGVGVHLAVERVVRAALQVDALGQELLREDASVHRLARALHSLARHQAFAGPSEVGPVGLAALRQLDELFKLRAGTRHAVEPRAAGTLWRFERGSNVAVVDARLPLLHLVRRQPFDRLAFDALRLVHASALDDRAVDEVNRQLGLGDLLHGPVRHHAFDVAPVDRLDLLARRRGEDVEAVRERAALMMRERQLDPLALR